MVKVATINVNGLTNVNKFSNLIANFQSESLDFVCVQETHWDDNFINSYKHLWSGDIYFSNSKHGFKGCALFVSKKYTENCNFAYSDDDGRYFECDVKINECAFKLICIYAPNIQKDRREFFDQIGDRISENSIVCGDFNDVMNGFSDRSKNMSAYGGSTKDLFDFASTNNLFDIWRRKNPGKNTFTRQQFVQGVLKQSRLDYIFTTSSILMFISYCFISHTTASDHSFVTAILNFNNYDKGPGLWIFNNKYLKEHEYCEGVKSLISKSLACPLYKTEQLIWWDNLKYRIKQFSILHAQKRRIQEQDDFWQIQTALNFHYTKANTVKDYDYSEIYELKNKLEQYEKQICDGAILRSKTRDALDTDKCSRYFLNLEKFKQESNIVKILKKSDGSIVNSTPEILEECVKFYTKLYTNEPINEVNQNKLFDLITDQLDEAKSKYCDSDISIHELYNSLKGMKKGKSPGPDGLTVEFYLHFWDILGQYYFQVISNMQELGELSNSMKRGTISLFFKKRGDKTELRNWRPISLLNVDYKIFSRTLALRLKTVVADLVSPDQSCCVPGRDIATNILNIRDIISFAELEDLPLYLLKLDAEKAFDRVSHGYMFNLLHKFGFGEKFINSIKILYKDIRSSVKVNGHVSLSFPILRSVRQGCGISALLYVLTSVPLNTLIKSNENIKGFAVPGCDYNSTVFQHADDTTLSLSNLDSVNEALSTVEIYCSGSGGKINAEKSELLLAGSAAVPNPDCLPVKVLHGAAKFLSVYLGPDEAMCERSNWDSKVNKIGRILNLWRQRGLQLRGKVLIVNIMCLSTLWYLLRVVEIPQWALDRIEKSIRSFIWNGKPPLIKGRSILGSTDIGGLNLNSVILKQKAFRLHWLSKYLSCPNNFIWKYFMSYFLKLYKNYLCSFELLFINYSKPALKVLPSFYRSMLISWNDFYNGKRPVADNYNDILNQPLFDNPQIVYDDKTLYFSDFIEAGLVKISDLCYIFIAGFLSVDAIFELVRESLPDRKYEKVEKQYNLILKCLPVSWTKIIRSQSHILRYELDLELNINDKTYDICQLNTSLVCIKG
ncbi:hypothetical protein SNE40_022369 [Patella caerulea]|uniref:Reverse transcriptase domain-containing protein n=1 Tax=Patella caerulea TaxID=87958 RepID=A0AAN8FW97_PATCE